MDLRRNGGRVMPRLWLPKPKQVTDLLVMLRAEGFDPIQIETTPEGKFSVSVGGTKETSTVTALEKWRAGREDA